MARLRPPHQQKESQKYFDCAASTTSHQELPGLALLIFLLFFFFFNFRLNVYFAKRAARDLGINYYRHTPGWVAGEFLQLQEFFVCFLYLRHKVQDNRTKACTR